MDINHNEEHKARSHCGLVDALVDCLALLVQDGLRGAGMQRALQQRVAAATSAGVAALGATARRPLRHRTARWARARLEGYLACQHWLAQGLDGETLAARIVRRIFAIWPCEAADYQRRYDEFLEKELEDPRRAPTISARVSGWPR